jgi:ketosteroid isomerase-like protein
MSQNTAVREEVLELGRRWAAAELAADADALSSLLTDDFVCVGPLGFVLNKMQYVGPRRSGDLTFEAYTWGDVALRQYGDDVAVAVGVQTQRGTYQGGDASGRFRVTQVAVRQSDRWVLAGLHYSPIAGPPA